VRLLDLLLRFVNIRLIFIDVGNNPVGFGDFGMSVFFCQIQLILIGFVKIQRIVFDFVFFVFCSKSKDTLCICVKQNCGFGWNSVNTRWMFVDFGRNSVAFG